MAEPFNAGRRCILLICQNLARLQTWKSQASVPSPHLRRTCAQPQSFCQCQPCRSWQRCLQHAGRRQRPAHACAQGTTTAHSCASAPSSEGPVPCCCSTCGKTQATFRPQLTSDTDLHPSNIRGPCSMLLFHLWRNPSNIETTTSIRHTPATIQDQCTISHQVTAVS